LSGTWNGSGPDPVTREPVEDLPERGNPLWNGRRTALREESRREADGRADRKV